MFQCVIDKFFNNLEKYRFLNASAVDGIIIRTQIYREGSGLVDEAAELGDGGCKSEILQYIRPDPVGYLAAGTDRHVDEFINISYRLFFPRLFEIAFLEHVGIELDGRKDRSQVIMK